MSAQKQKVLLFSTIRTTFIEDDLHMLERICDVKWICSSGFLTIGKIKYAMLFRKVGIAWFASVYSGVVVFIARLLGKESIIIIGGADVVTNSHLGYGLLLARWKRPILRYAVRNATKVLPTSEYLKETTQALCGYEGENIEVCFPGLDHKFWHPNKKRENVVLSVAHCDTSDRISIKGVDLVLKVAEKMREVRFRIIGVTPEVVSRITATVPENVQFQSPVGRNQLLKEYQKAIVYLQLSRVESFGIATAESMLCGCIPVVSDAGGLPETVGNNGHVVPSEDVNAAVNALNAILQGESGLSGKTCRKWVASRFSMQDREERFTDMLLG
ncbi:MAG: glycosyltransferase family 4 protein [Candidatus Neomarinimicrobiota bacterium]|nr:glycosyltransferase family 4 protein [Candidatus Neomarinimicrobiota bacterium]